MESHENESVSERVETDIDVLSQRLSIALLPLYLVIVNV